MKCNYLLIDLENIRPKDKDLELLSKHPFRIYTFVGANQKVPSYVESAMQTFGSNAKYIKISGTGPNALDFHIAFYISELSANDQKACFYNIIKR